MSRHIKTAFLVFLCFLSIGLAGWLVYRDWQNLPLPVEGISQNVNNLAQSYQKPDIESWEQTLHQAQAALLSRDAAIIEDDPDQIKPTALVDAFRESIRVQQDIPRLQETVSRLSTALAHLEAEGLFDEAIVALDKHKYLLGHENQDLRDKTRDLLNHINDEALRKIAIERGFILAATNTITKRFHDSITPADCEHCIALCEATINQVRKANMPVADASAREYHFRARAKKAWMPIAIAVSEANNNHSLLTQEIVSQLKDFIQLFDERNNDIAKQYQDFVAQNLHTAHKFYDWNRLASRLRLTDELKSPEAEVNLEGVVPSEAIESLHRFYRDYPSSTEANSSRDLARRFLYTLFATDPTLAPDYTFEDWFHINIRRDGSLHEGIWGRDDQAINESAVTFYDEDRNEIDRRHFFQDALTGEPRQHPEHVTELAYINAYSNLSSFLRNPNFNWATDSALTFADQCEQMGHNDKRVDRLDRATSIAILIQRCPDFLQVIELQK